ncbi:hypothetical protein C8R44DRAFT_789223, partial [Mycena epipterygia]
MPTDSPSKTGFSSSRRRNHGPHLETFRPTRLAPELPTKYSGLTTLLLPPIICRATSTDTAVLKGNQSHVSCTFPDDKLQAELMTRFERWVQAIGDPDIPQEAKAYWKTVVRKVETDNYLDEDWVVDFYAAIKTVVSALIEATRAGIYVENDSTHWQFGGVKGDKTLCVMKEGINPVPRLSGVPMELKQDSAFLENLGVYVQGPNPMHSGEDLEGGSAIMAKV